MNYNDFYLSVKEKVDLNLLDNKYTDAELLENIEKLVQRENEENSMYLSIAERINISKKLFNAIRGFWILNNIMEDDDVTEIMINGYNKIFIEKKGKIHRCEESFESEEKLNDLIQRIVGKAGREVNQANPIVDTRLPDGSRVNVVLSPISLNGATVTIRKFSKNPMTIAKLIEHKSITEEVAKLLENLVKAKYNIFISGGTGSGKTTFLNALSNFIPKSERIITIEDSAELQIVGIENLVSLETRNSNTSGVGELTIRDLIKSALRMRPERIVVGEVRGKEALDMLQAMNTGHDGSLSTGHANSSIDMLSRLETMVLTGSDGLPIEAVRKQIASSIDIIIHLSRMRDKTRRVIEISEICGFEGNEIKLNKLYEFKENEKSKQDYVDGELKRTDNSFQNYAKLHSAGINITV